MAAKCLTVPIRERKDMKITMNILMTETDMTVTSQMKGNMTFMEMICRIFIESSRIMEAM